jgi:hypothetical protein
MILTALMLWALTFQAISNTRFTGLTKALLAGALCLVLGTLAVLSVAIPSIFITGAASTGFINAIPAYTATFGIGALGHFAFKVAEEVGAGTLLTPSVR